MKRHTNNSPSQPAESVNHVNRASNTESFITGFRGQGGQSSFGDRYIRHLKIDDDKMFDKFYHRVQIIGQGNYGIVYEVKNPKDNSHWAMKIIHKKSLSMNHLKSVEREINILKLLHHPHIVSLQEVYESSKYIYLILEKCNYDLTYLCRLQKTFSEIDTKRIIADLTSAVAYLHKNDIVHRDIKLDNILVTINPADDSDKLFIKLSDFGLSIVKSGRAFTNMLHDRCGTLVYMAPEILISQSYSQQCDIWAIGIIMYVLLVGTVPFLASSDSGIVTKICKIDPNFEIMEGKRSPECIDVLKKLLNKNPAARITASETLNHPWLRGKQITVTHNVLDMMRLWNLDNKTTSESALEDATDVREIKRLSKEEAKGRRSVVPVAVQNLAFDKQSERGSANQEGLRKGWPKPNRSGLNYANRDR